MENENFDDELNLISVNLHFSFFNIHFTFSGVGELAIDREPNWTKVFHDAF